MRIAFWNTHKNEGINRIVCDIIKENRIDIAVLAEYKANSKKLIRELSGQGIQMEQYVTFGCERIVMFGSKMDGKGCPRYNNMFPEDIGNPQINST